MIATLIINGSTPDEVRSNLLVLCRKLDVELRENGCACKQQIAIENGIALLSNSHAVEFSSCAEAERQLRPNGILYWKAFGSGWHGYLEPALKTLVAVVNY